MLQIYLEPFKLYAESENAVTLVQYPNTITLGQNQLLVNCTQLTVSCFGGFSWQVGRSNRGYEFLRCISGVWSASL